MTQPEITPISIGSLDLAAMLCSRVCHDVISPVGAIVNGLEVLEDESDPSMRDVAIELIKKSAASASARLQFCRLAFGAAGSAGATIDTGDAEAVARGLLATEKTSINWRAPRRLLSKNVVKLLLNLAQIAGATIPRGGAVEIQIEGEGDAAVLEVTSNGSSPRLQAGFGDLLKGQIAEVRVDAHNIQPYFAGLVARECGMDIEIEQHESGFRFVARPLSSSIEFAGSETEAETTSL
jgi:histidine phosphotransferase ChpT